MASPFKVTRVPYFDIQDTTQEVGITRRQLDHWEAEGLLQPELGADSKKYTLTDIRRLKALRHLVVDLKLPIPFVKDLVVGGIDFGATISNTLIKTASLYARDYERLGGESYFHGQILDLESGSIQSKSDIAQEWWYEKFSTFSEKDVELKVYELIFLLFRIVKSQYPRPAAYMERRNAILDEVSTLADVARTEVQTWDDDTEDGAWLHISPSLPDEAPPNKYTFWSRAKMLDRYRDGLQRKGDFWTQRFMSRFWTKEEIDRMSPSWKPPAKKEQQADATIAVSEE